MWVLRCCKSIGCGKLKVEGNWTGRRLKDIGLEKLDKPMAKGVEEGRLLDESKRSGGPKYL